MGGARRGMAGEVEVEVTGIGTMTGILTDREATRGVVVRRREDGGVPATAAGAGVQGTAAHLRREEAAVVVGDGDGVRAIRATAVGVGVGAETGEGGGGERTACSI